MRKRQRKKLEKARATKAFSTWMVRGFGPMEVASVPWKLLPKSWDDGVATHYPCRTQVP